MFLPSQQEYFKTGLIRCPPSVTVPELREACDYLLIPFNARTVKCHNLSELLLYFFRRLIVSSNDCCVLPRQCVVHVSDVV